MGNNFSYFEVPVCNSFQAIARDNQICYETDLEQYKNHDRDLRKQLQEGLVLYLDYNEDKQLRVEKRKKRDENEAQVYMDTISIMV